MSNHDDLGFVEDSSPASPHDDLGFVQDAPASDMQLKQALGNFDDMQKLSKEDQAKAYAMQKKDAQENTAAAGVGLSKGAFMPVELANKLIPGEPVKNLREKLIAKTEKGIASVLGDDQTQELYNNLPEAELEKRNTASDQAAVKKAPIAAALGEMGGSLPATIAAGGAVAAGGKALAAGSSPVGQALIKAGTNIAGNTAIGEGLGIAHSDADTLQQRAKDALPSAAISGVLSTGAEGLGLAANPAIQEEILNPAAESIRNSANRASALSLKPTAATLAKLDKNGQTEALGRKMLDEGITTPLASLSSKAEKLQGLADETGSGINQTLGQLDSKASTALEQADNNDQRRDLLEAILSKRDIANQVEGRTLNPLEASGDPNNLSFRTKELLSKMEQTGGEDTSLASLQQLNKFKQGARQGINYNTDSGAAAQNTKNFTRELNDEVLSRAKQVDSLTGGQGMDDFGGGELSDKLINQNKEYGMLSTGAKAANQSAAKAELAKDATTPAATGLGYLMQGPMGAVKGATVGLAKKAISTYGNNVKAVGLDKLSDILQSAPEALGEYAPVLQSAAKRGTSSLAAANFVLSQRSPEYRDMTDKLDDNKDRTIDFKEGSTVTPGK